MDSNIVRNAQAKPMRVERDLTIDKAEDQLRGITGLRPDCDPMLQSVPLGIVSNLGVLSTAFHPRVLAHSRFLSTHNLFTLSYLIRGIYIPRSPTLLCTGAVSPTARTYRGSTYDLSRVL